MSSFPSGKGASNEGSDLPLIDLRAQNLTVKAELEIK